MNLLILIGLAVTFVGIFYTWYQIYALMRLDAEMRGIPHPKGTALFLSSGQKGEGLLAYLIYRKRYPLTSPTPKDRAKSDQLKKQACLGIVFMAVGACIAIIGLSIS
ncbi:hypothetical protein lacNasYZ03_16830 [Lactobacillus nasalidis]|uniref:DUF3899 domain-containing protein n=1 Tax=Lactobacillus nasalidis TaxID=2797258 RepID=A0ABQ3W602_9LACO|nr:hypothetical protein [Lactobacillus nasalidis]GHV97387.1 hypothetical protein lacNasYZ01_05690 [Lactobacillus nasalidis]GHV99292.1 hypothetical protein lacNasYZ02_07220 [Lactobacillus nasalidis]GHW01996.1 hypothetical protein lacNasYZ03_16830 [Lactobacillus nasalidis]